MTGIDKRRAPNLRPAVARALRDRQVRDRGYREQALRMLPWICGRCGREFTRANLQELTVHHRDHDHDNNPADGSNWELLCVYCHDNEHARQAEARPGANAPAARKRVSGMYRPFADLAGRLRGKKEDE